MRTTRISQLSHNLQGYDEANKTADLVQSMGKKYLKQSTPIQMSPNIQLHEKMSDDLLIKAEKKLSVISFLIYYMSHIRPSAH